MLKERLFKVLDLTIIIFPWFLFGIAGGMFIGEYRLNLEINNYWSIIHRESLVRERILDYSLSDLNGSKFIIGDAKAKALVKVKEEIRRAQ